MEIAVGTLERGAQSLGRYSSHTEAKDEDNEDRGDRVKDHMDAEPLWSSGAEVAPCQEGDREGKANGNAGESS